MIKQIKENDKNFHFEVYFSEVFHDKGGFDVVIANPPYGAELNSDEREILDRKYAQYKTQIKNSAIYFVYKATELLNENGVHTFIIPKSICYSIGWNKCATVIIGGLNKFIDTGKAFEEVKLEQVIFVRTLKRKNNHYVNGIYDGEKVREYTEVGKDLFTKFNVLLTGQTIEEMALIKKITSKFQRKWADYVSIERGLNWQSQVSKKPGSVPIHRGAQLSPYFLDKATDFINIDRFNKIEYGYQLNPKILNQLALAHVQNPYPHFFLQAAFDINNSLVFETISCTFVKNDLMNIKFLLAINNSKLFAWLLYKFIYSNAIRSTRYDEQYIGKVPCPEFEGLNQTPVINVVDEIHLITKDADYPDNSTKQAKVKELEHQIDQLVYKLYELTPGEIAVVEGDKSK